MHKRNDDKPKELGRSSLLKGSVVAEQESYRFNFDLDEIKKSIESGTISFPPGLTGPERKAWLLEQKQVVKQ